MYNKSVHFEKTPRSTVDRHNASYISGVNASNVGGSQLGLSDHRKAQKEMSSQEKLSLVEVKPIEKAALDKVFNRFCRATPKREEYTPAYFTAEDVAKVLIELQFKMTKHEIDLMIWVSIL